MIAPNNTIMVNTLPLHVTENEIRSDILVYGLVPKDIRLIRRKDTGASRGFAFVEFSTLPEAVRWMEAKQVASTSTSTEKIQKKKIKKIQNIRNRLLNERKFVCMFLCRLWLAKPLD